MLKVLLVDTIISDKHECPRTAIVSLASALRESGIGVEIKQFNLEEKEMNLEKFREYELKFVSEVIERSNYCDYLLLSCWTGSWNRTRLTANKVKQTHPKTKIAVGGPHVDFTEMYRRHLQNPLEILAQESPETDIFAYGECEETITELIQHSVKKTKGLVCRDGNKILNNGWRPLIISLDSLPFPNLRDDELIEKRWAYIESARGCLYSCDFCSEPLRWSNPGKIKTYRRKSPFRLLDEIEYYYERGISHFRFTDSTLTLNPDLEKICNGIIQGGLNQKINWSSFARVNEVLKVPLELLKESGCETLLIGFESGSEDRLEGIRKGYNKTQAYEVARRLKDLQIKIRGSWIVGFPDESEKDFQATLDFARELNLDAYAVHAYEDQKTKFKSYQFGLLDFDLDMPIPAFGELVELTDKCESGTEMHYLPRIEASNVVLRLSDREKKLFDWIRSFNEYTKKDQDYDTKDRFDRIRWK